MHFGYFLLLSTSLGTEQSVSIYCMDTEHLPGRIGIAGLHENWLPRNPFLSFVCVAYVCYEMYVCMYMYVYVHVEARSWRWKSSSVALYLILWNNISHWAWSSLVQLGCLVSKCQGCSEPLLPVLRLQTHSTTSGFFLHRCVGG